MTGKEIAQELTRCFNSFNCTEDACGFINELTNTHRTLQQTIVGYVIFGVIREMALKYDNGIYDDRNKLACQYCKAAWEALKNENPTRFSDEIPSTRLPMV